MSQERSHDCFEDTLTMCSNTIFKYSVCGTKNKLKYTRTRIYIWVPAWAKQQQHERSPFCHCFLKTFNRFLSCALSTCTVKTRGWMIKEPTLCASATITWSRRPRLAWRLGNAWLSSGRSSVSRRRLGDWRSRSIKLSVPLILHTFPSSGHVTLHTFLTTRHGVLGVRSPCTLLHLETLQTGCRTLPTRSLLLNTGMHGPHKALVGKNTVEPWKGKP